MSIPGLLHIPLEESCTASIDGMKLTSFDLKTFAVPEAHIYGKCRPVTEFDKISQLGEGTFGTVYKVKDRKSNETLALKKLKLEKDSLECMPLSFTREITILKSLNHDNIVNLLGIAVGKSLESIYLVFEYCPYVLTNVIDDEDVLLEQPQIKCIMKQLFTGLDYIHKHHILHRDLNVSNILFSNSGFLKISDFGCARKTASEKSTPNIGSRWYRAPELLFGAENYDSSVDMWSTGCIFAELLRRKPLFRADTDAELIILIIDCLGTPTENLWPGFSQLPLPQSYNLRIQPYNKLTSHFENQPTSCISLLHKLLVYNPESRSSADQCLNHLYFTEKPAACSAEALLPALEASVL